MICENCQGEFHPKRKIARFCSDRCRSAWRRASGCAGIIKNIRQLARGGYSVIIYFPSPPSLLAGTRCRLETE